MKMIDDVFSKLPPELQQEVLDFAHFLLEKRTRKAGRTLRQGWAGALSNYKDQYTSLDLQKKSSEWRDDG